MTEAAVIHYAGMGEVCGYKTRGKVAHATILTGRQVHGMLAHSNATVMTCRTIFNDAAMIKFRPAKRRGVMAA